MECPRNGPLYPYSRKNIPTTDYSRRNNPTVARVKEYEHCTDEEARQYILESDATRAHYHEHYIHTAWGKTNEYDLTINSAIGFDEAVEVISQAYRAITERGSSSI